MKRTSFLKCLLLLLPTLLLIACGLAVPGGSVEGPPVIISSKRFTESRLLGEMYAQLLEARGISVKRQFEGQNTRELHASMRAGLIDLYPEYTSTGLLAILQEPAKQDGEEIYLRVKSQYEEQFGFIWLDRTPFNNTWALVTTPEIADAYDLGTISELSENAGELKFGAVAAFYEREDGLSNLQVIYDGLSFAEQVTVSDTDRYPALLEGRVDVLAAYGTDGEIAGHNLVLLEDDEGFWPPYNAAPVIRREILENYPSIPEILNPLAPLLTQEAMTGMNWQVDGPEKRSYEEVARAFLTEHDLLAADPNEP